jgi:opacity protein-like surface antigen
MKKNFFVAVALLVTVMSNAQQSASAASGEAKGSKGIASYTIGQVAYTTPVGARGATAQGIQQPYEISEIITKEIKLESSMLLTTYPNPTTDGITLDIKNYQQEKLSYELLSITGQLLETNKITQNSTTIVMKGRAQGTYLLKVTQQDYPIKTFKIIKN